MISQRFRNAYHLHDGPRYRVAMAVGVSPVWLSKVVHGAVSVPPGDPRVVAIGRQLGLKPQECFDAVREENPGTRCGVP